MAASTAANSAPNASPAEPAAVVDATVGRDLIAENLIKNHVLAAVAASIVPVPLFDIAAVVAVQLRMIAKLSDLYGTPFSESLGRNIITSLAGGVFGYGAGITVAVSLTKLIPGVGWMLGMVSLPVMAGAATYAIGQVIAKQYETGGDLCSLSTEAMRSFYDEQFQKGKKLAEAAKSKLKAGKAVPPEGDAAA